MTRDPRLDDPDPEVRCAAVGDLPLGLGDVGPDHPNVRALLAAFDDPDADVRDWAVFGLGVQLSVDSPEIRDALFRMLDDDAGADTPGEAACGLAKRKDPRVYDHIAAELARPYPGNLWVEAAAELGDLRLLPLLQRLKDAGWDRDDARGALLDEALETCALRRRTRQRPVARGGDRRPRQPKLQDRPGGRHGRDLQ